MKTAYSFDKQTGIYIGPVVLDDSDLSPLEPGVYLLPAGVVEIEPPLADDGQCVRFESGAWVVKDIPVPPVVEPPAPEPLTPLQQIAALEAAKPITHRMLRELSMTVAQIAAAVTGTDMMNNPAVQEIVALEQQIAAIRSQL